MPIGLPKHVEAVWLERPEVVGNERIGEYAIKVVLPNDMMIVLPQYSQGKPLYTDYYLKPPLSVELQTKIRAMKTTELQYDD